VPSKALVNGKEAGIQTHTHTYSTTIIVFKSHSAKYSEKTDICMDTVFYRLQYNIAISLTLSHVNFTDL